MDLVWKDIPGYDGLYQVSSFGDVKSMTRTALVKNGVRTVRERVLRQTTTPLGYKQVVLSNHGHTKKLLVHRLVGITFLDNSMQLPCINHIDGNPSNNCVDNLEWCTYAYNSNYYLCKSKQSMYMLTRYKNNPKFLHECKERLDKYHKLSSKPVCQLAMDGTLIKIWDSTNSVYTGGFIGSNVRQCASGKRKTHHGYMWVWYTDYIKIGDV